LIKATAKPQITPDDRFGLTLCLAIITHGIVILGVTFSADTPLQPEYETMEIILVQQKSDPVKDAAFLAQAHLEGGGDTAERLSPSTPLPAPFPDQQPELTTPPLAETGSAANPQPTNTEPEPETQPDKRDEKLTVEKDHSEKPVIKSTEEVKSEMDEHTQPSPEQTETPALPNATQLLANSLKIASLSAEIRNKLESKSQRPRRKFISASTKEYKYAAYMEAWRAKVERIGNLNYPDDARKNKLTGSLILDVALNGDGSVNQITVRRSSGSKILDDAAVRIVELSSPFASVSRENPCRDRYTAHYAHLAIPE
jgi:TonB family C-terminal domain